jgi:C4-dicarboxylate transporter DctQ subunit
LEFPSFLKRLNRASAIFAGILIFFIGILSTMEGIVRSFFSSPTSWSVDVSVYMLIWAIFLATASAFQDKNHVSVDFVREGMGRRWGSGVQRYLTIVGYLMALVYVVAFTWSSLSILYDAVKFEKLTRAIVQIPVSYLYIGMVIGSIAMLVTLVFIIISLISGKNDYL